MESKDIPTKEKEQEQSDNILKKIKSNFILKKFFDYIHKIHKIFNGCQS